MRKNRREAVIKLKKAVSDPILWKKNPKPGGILNG
jgi:hypothetical protein